MSAMVNVNGRILDREHAVISVFDHGFLYGEGIYEVLRTYDGVPFLFDRHMRRLRNSARIVDRLADHTAASPDARPTDALRINKSLTRFISRQEFRFGLLTSNLRLDSPHFRYALRVTAAAAIAMTLGSNWLSPEFSAHSYWIMLTIVIIMKPGFALTRQRNGWRLMGTLLGCICALLLFNNPSTLPAALTISGRASFSDASSVCSAADRSSTWPRLIASLVSSSPARSA